MTIRGGWLMLTRREAARLTLADILWIVGTNPPAHPLDDSPMTPGEPAR